jgi:hypothetical protein
VHLDVCHYAPLPSRGQVHSPDDRASAFDPPRFVKEMHPKPRQHPRKDCRDFCRDTPSKWVVIPSKSASAWLRSEAANRLIPSNFDHSVASVQSAESELLTEGL